MLLKIWKSEYWIQEGFFGSAIFYDKLDFTASNLQGHCPNWGKKSLMISYIWPKIYLKTSVMANLFYLETQYRLNIQIMIHTDSIKKGFQICIQT